MPLYEYYCRQCESKFELLRSMSRSEEPAICPSGHEEAQRVLSLFSSFSKGADGSNMPLGGGSACAACTSANCSTCDLV
jgi:putative FmdB family regulatory protein